MHPTSHDQVTRFVSRIYPSNGQIKYEILFETAAGQLLSFRVFEEFQEYRRILQLLNAIKSRPESIDLTLTQSS